MKEILNKLIASIHWFLLLYVFYSVWLIYDDHSIQYNEILSRQIKLEDDIKKQSRELKNWENNSSRENELRVGIELEAKSIEEIQKQLPAEINSEEIVTTLRSEMSLLNIKDGTVTQSDEQKSTFFISRDFAIKAQGTFLQFLVLFERLKEKERVFHVKEFKFTNSAEDQRGRYFVVSFESVVQAFRYNPDFKVDRGL